MCVIRPTLVITRLTNIWRLRPPEGTVDPRQLCHEDLNYWRHCRSIPVCSSGRRTLIIRSLTPSETENLLDNQIRHSRHDENWTSFPLLQRVERFSSSTIQTSFTVCDGNGNNRFAKVTVVCFCHIYSAELVKSSGGHVTLGNNQKYGENRGEQAVMNTRPADCHQGKHGKIKEQKDSSWSPHISSN
jgi:hypothetical protein